MSPLAFTRRGAGAPLVLLHGIGSSRHAWEPVIPALAERFDVLAVDLPGFGDSEPLPAQVEPHPAALAASVASWLDGLGITGPHIAGNSLGGWVALELASRRPVASLALLSPAGLWRGRTPLYERVSLRITRWFARHATELLCHLMRYRLARIVAFAQTHGQPSRLSPDYARTAVRSMGHCPGFEAVMHAAEHQCFVSGSAIECPVTVVFGSREFLLPHHSRHLDQLPDSTRVEELPGCGHVPMADNPNAVAALIVKATGHARLTKGSRAAAQ